MRPSKKYTKLGIENQLIRVRERLRKTLPDEEIYIDNYENALDTCWFGNYKYGLVIYPHMNEDRKNLKDWFKRVMK